MAMLKQLFAYAKLDSEQESVQQIQQYMITQTQLQRRVSWGGDRKINTKVIGKSGQTNTVQIKLSDLRKDYAASE